jgi:hypothetical protein
MGTEGVRRAGDYILGELAKLGLEVIEQEFEVRRGEQDEAPIALRNLGAEIPGSSGDAFLLVAPYDTRRYESFRFLGVNDGGSGAALLLEIARVLAADPLPYTTWLIFLDGEAPLAPDSVSVADPSHFGSLALAKRIREKGMLAGIRLALVLNRVCDADLRVARDLHSHRIYREEFWRAASRLGHSDAFPPDGSFESPEASHHELAAAGLHRVVALVDSSFGGNEPPGLYAGTEDDDLEHCSADSLEAVGKVALEALDKISQRLAKIDRFAESPLEGPGELTFESLAAAPEADDTAAPQTGDETVVPSAQQGDEELTQGAPEEPPAAPEAPVADDAAVQSAGAGEGELKQAAPEEPPANREAPEVPR